MSIDPNERAHSDFVSLKIIRGESWNASQIKNQYYRNHCKTLARTFRPGRKHSAIVERLVAPCLELFDIIEKRTQLLYTFPPEYRCIQQLLRVASYASHWKRSPTTWRPGHERCLLHLLIDHLFCEYPIPDFYFNAWQKRGRLHEPERDWFCHVAIGGSIRKAPGLITPLSPKAAHLLQEAPPKLSVVQAIRYAQVKAMGGSDELIKRVIKTELGNRFYAEDTWHPLLMMVSGARCFEPAAFGPLVEYISNQMQRYGTFRVKGKKLADLERAALNSYDDLMAIAKSYGYSYTHADLLDPKIRQTIQSLQELHWPRMKGVELFEYQESKRRRWRIIELISQRALLREGNVLNHCVSSYGVRCRRGDSHVFSLQRWEEKEGYWDAYVTLEVSPHTRRVNQARSINNSPPNEFELKIICRWLEKYQLHWNA